MENKNELHIIEEKYDVKSPKTDNINIWPLLRHSIFYEIFCRKVNFNSTLRTRDKIQLFKTFFYGWKNLFRLKKYDYIFFNNADKRTHEIDQKKYDIFFDAWADKIGQEKSLFIEWAIQKHFNPKNTYSQNVITDLIFKLGSVICSFFIREDVNNLDVIYKIVNDYNLKLNLNKKIKSKLGELKFYRFLFRQIKPKSVFLISSFTKESIVVAAHLQGVKVFEVQHGYIGYNHQFYNSHYRFDSLYYPDYLISFGNIEKSRLPKNFIFKSEQIIPVGSLYLENIKNNYESIQLKSLRDKYSKVFCVTLQTVKDTELLEWVCSQAKYNKKRLFILMPRDNRIDYSKHIKLDNCILLPEHNIYQVLKYSDYNITIYSTTAVEASLFNVKTLFYNLDNLSAKYFDVNTLNASLIEEDQDIQDEHLNTIDSGIEPYFISGYHKNVENTILTF